MGRTPAWAVVAVVLLAGCGGSDSSSSGGEDSRGSDSQTEPSAGDQQYVDPFQDPRSEDVLCLSKREVQQKIDRIASRVQNPERKQRATQAVRDRAC